MSRGRRGRPGASRGRPAAPGGSVPSAAAEANEAFHDRVAARYDVVYGGAYWDAYERLSWDGVRPHIPRDLRARVADLGCGTGRYGLKLLKSGYPVTFVDLSQKMLDQAAQKAAALGPRAEALASFVKADLAELGALESGRFALLVAQGDPISHAGERAERAFRECARVLAPGGVLVASVDAAYGAIEHFLEAGDAAGLERFLRSGMTEWLAHDRAERFPVRMFTPRDLRALALACGLEVVDLYGKTVLPLRRCAGLLEDPDARERILALEKRLCREEALLGRASHLQLAARRPAASGAPAASAAAPAGPPEDGRVE
jgi:SAM-dependent methyltransferase